MVLRKRVTGGTAQKTQSETIIYKDSSVLENFSCFPFVYKGRKLASTSATKYIVIFAVVLFISYQVVEFLIEKHDVVIATHDVEFTRFFTDIKCSKDYGNDFKGCVPKKCGRCVMDLVFDKSKVIKLRQIAEKGFQYGVSSGGASILDLHVGALSMKDKFVNLYKLKPNLFTKEDFKLYTEMKNEVHKAVAKEFGIPLDKLYLTKPTFFSRITSKPAKTIHDEYWHPHVDKETYGSFYYTSLLYLSEYGTDFMGGRFMFIDTFSNKSIEPKVGRLSFFTSGSENKHFVEPVTSGIRFAITISFTCDKSKAIADPGQP